MFSYQCQLLTTYNYTGGKLAVRLHVEEEMTFQGPK